MTSLNLYDYSLAKNIEVGIICNYASKGLLGKVLDSSNAIISQGVDKVSQDVFGMGKDVDPIEKFEMIYKNSELKFKTEPILADKGGIKGVLGGKKLMGFNIIVDNLSNTIKGINITKTEPVANKTKEDQFPKTETVSNVSTKMQSASQLSKNFGVLAIDITNLMQKAGLIDGNKITKDGLSKGLVMKSYMGKEYIAYPENLTELNELKI